MQDAVFRHLVGYLSTQEVRYARDIGKELGCSPKAARAHVANLRDLGVGIDSVAGTAYLLQEPVELLDRALILATMDTGTADKLRGLKIDISVDSTNSALRQLAIAEQHAVTILAEHQSGGRGRRGRLWHSPFGRNLYLSLGWRFDQSLPELASLPLVVALATARALTRVGLKGHRVKWPNDLLLNGCKICGCLVEVQGDAKGPAMQ